MNVPYKYTETLKPWSKLLKVCFLERMLYIFSKKLSLFILFTIWVLLRKKEFLHHGILFKLQTYIKRNVFFSKTTCINNYHKEFYLLLLLFACWKTDTHTHTVYTKKKNLINSIYYIQRLHFLINTLNLIFNKLWLLIYFSQYVTHVTTK